MSEDVDLVVEHIDQALNGEYNDAIGNRMIGQPPPGPDGKTRPHYTPVEMQARQLAAALDYSADRLHAAYDNAAETIAAAPATTSARTGDWARASDHDAPVIYAKWTGVDPTDQPAAAEHWQRFRQAVITALHTRTRQLIDEHDPEGPA